VDFPHRTAFICQIGASLSDQTARGSFRRKVFLAGIFDLPNYGDLLFPLIARWRLESAGVDVIPVAPTSRAPHWDDAMVPVDVATMLTEPVDAVLIGGGYMINVHPMNFEEYADGGTSDWAMAGVWLGATMAGALHDAPVLWNAPGVPHPHGRRIRPLVDAALSAAGYVSVRDRGGAELLAAPASVDVSIVPDTIADLARMWPKDSLSESFHSLMKRKNADPSERYLALHLRDRSVAGLSMADLAARVERFASVHGLIPLLVAVGRSHDDPKTARALARHLRGRHILLDDPSGLREITAVLAHSTVYIGASLHGYIASSAYGVPGVLVARPAYRKFAGFLENTARLEDLARTWEEAFEVGAARANEARSTRIPNEALTALDAHWTRIQTEIEQPAAKRSERRAFLAALVRAGVEANGPQWALRPILDLMRPYRGTTPSSANPTP